MNNIILLGKLCTDPNIKKFNDKSNVSFTLAVKRPYRSNSQETDFIRCSAWCHNAEFISRNFKKGDNIAIQGMLQNNQYEKNGTKQYYPVVITERVFFTGSKLS